jgi:hypothetical protein
MSLTMEVEILRLVSLRLVILEELYTGSTRYQEPESKLSDASARAKPVLEQFAILCE